jgi:hypothetical protein
MRWRYCVHCSMHAVCVRCCGLCTVSSRAALRAVQRFTTRTTALLLLLLLLLRYYNFCVCCTYTCLYYSTLLSTPCELRCNAKRFPSNETCKSRSSNFCSVSFLFMFFFLGCLVLLYAVCLDLHATHIHTVTQGAKGQRAHDQQHIACWQWTD